MEKWASKWLECILRDKDFNEWGVQSPSHTISTSMLAPLVQAFGFQCPPPPPFANNPSGSSPFYTYI